jgi:hypothetical protein
VDLVKKGKNFLRANYFASPNNSTHKERVMSPDVVDEIGLLALLADPSPLFWELLYRALGWPNNGRVVLLYLSLQCSCTFGYD